MIDLDALEAKARAATPALGLMNTKAGHAQSLLCSAPVQNPVIPRPDIVATTRYSDRLMANDCANLAHIAAFDPPTALARIGKEAADGK